MSKKVINRRNRTSATQSQGFNFIDCPSAESILMKTENINSLYMFDGISFMAKDLNNNIFEIKGLFFDFEKGWYDTDAVNPRYYGKDIHAACIEYAVDKAISDNLFLYLAVFGKERPAKSALVLNRSKIVSQLKSRGYVIYDR